MLLGLNQRTYGSSCRMSIVVGGLCVPYDPRDVLLWAKAPHKVCKGSTV